MRYLSIIALAAVLATGVPAIADVPQSICVQGYLETTDVSPIPVNGDVDFAVAIYDAETGDTQVWPPSSSPPKPIDDVQVENGLFALCFGDGELTPEVFAGPRWIEFSTKDPNDPGILIPMSPRVELHTAPYAFRVGFVDSPELTDDLTLGTEGEPGKLRVLNATDVETVSIDGSAATDGGQITLNNRTGLGVVKLRTDLAAGEHADSGRLNLLRGDGQGFVTLNAEGRGALFFGDEGLVPPATVQFVGDATDGGAELSMRNGQSPNQETIVLDANGGDAGARIALSNGSDDPNHPNQETITLEAKGGGEEPLGARLDLRNDAGNLGAVLSAGAPGVSSAKLLLWNCDPSNPRTTIRLYGNADPSGDGAVVLYGPTAWGARLRTFDGHGNLDLFRNDGVRTVNLDGSTGSAQFGALSIDSFDADTARLRPSVANGDVFISDDGGMPEHGITVANGGNVGIGTASPSEKLTVAGDILINGDMLDIQDDDSDTKVLVSTGNGGQCRISAGPGQERARLQGDDGDDGAALRLWNGQSSNQETIVLDGNDGEAGGRINVCNDGGTPLIQLIGDDPYVSNNDDAHVCVKGKVSARVFFTGEGCDVAEAFELSDRNSIKPGMVLVIDPVKAGNLKASAQAYDRRVAGIVSGAGNLRAGMKLGSRADGSNDLPIALSGRVYCYVDATERAVEVGDLLTTSNTPGYAMKAADRDRAFGAVIGKAMEPLAKGETGLVLVLVALQ